MDASTRLTHPPSRRAVLTALRHASIYGGAAAVCAAGLALMEYRFLVVDRSVEMYTALVGVLFAGLGIWLGRAGVPRASVEVEAARVPAGGAFVRDERRVRELGLTPRELEILDLIAGGLSNREIAERLFVSENTVKTHSSRIFDKLGAKRRTQAVRIGKASGLIP